MYQDFLSPNRQSKQEEVEKLMLNHYLKEQNSFSTKSIHYNQEPEPIHGSVNIPVHITSTYCQKRPGEIWSKFDYTRCGNPTRDVLDQVLGHLENGKHCQTQNSFQSALTVVLLYLKQSQEILITSDIDYETQEILDHFKSHFSYKYHKVDTWNYENIEEALNKNSKIKMIILQTPSYSMCKLSDIQKISQLAKQKGITIVVDNSLASPVLCLPLDLGADIVINKLDHLITGHNDLSMGSVTVNDQSLHDRLYLISKSYGAVSTPLNSYLCLREIKTMELRVKEIVVNTHVLASWVAQQPQVQQIFYCGLQTDLHQYQLMTQQMNSNTARFGFILKTGKSNLDHLISKLELFSYGDTCGVKSHVFVKDNIVVVSPGIEDIHDLLINFQQAFNYLDVIAQKQLLTQQIRILNGSKKIKKTPQKQIQSDQNITVDSPNKIKDNQ